MIQKKITKLSSPKEFPRAELNFEQIFKIYYKPIVYFFSRRGASPLLAEDLAQEVLLRVYLSLKDYRGTSSLESWIFAISANIWRNHLRNSSTLKKSVREISLSSFQESLDDESSKAVRSPLESEESDPLDNVLSNENTRLLFEAIEELPTQMRRCIQLWAMQGMKYREIAETMQISMQTVRSQLSQARQRLRSVVNKRATSKDEGH